jgi:hypothetical protein
MGGKNTLFTLPNTNKFPLPGLDLTQGRRRSKGKLGWGGIEEGAIGMGMDGD